MNNMTRITVSIGESKAKKFAELTRQIGVSGTALLRRTLPAELDYLAALPPNSETAEKRARVITELGNALSDTPPKTVRFNITLDRKDAERMNQICQENRIPRDGFIRAYINFLVEGLDDVCEAPLMKISKILANPRLEYQKRLSEREILYTEDGKGMIIDETVSQDNPYSHLHFDDDLLNALELFMKNARSESK
jgi:hypothetical protein